MAGLGQKIAISPVLHWTLGTEWAIRSVSGDNLHPWKAALWTLPSNIGEIILCQGFFRLGNQDLSLGQAVLRKTFKGKICLYSIAVLECDEPASRARVGQ